MKLTLLSDPITYAWCGVVTCNTQMLVTIRTHTLWGVLEQEVLLVTFLEDLFNDNIHCTVMGTRQYTIHWIYLKVDLVTLHTLFDER